MKASTTMGFWKKFKAQTNRREAMELYNTVINTPLGDVVEVGSASGGTTIVLIGAAEEVNKTVYSVDPYPESFEGKVANYTPGLMKDFREGFKDNILTGQWKNIVQYNEDISGCIDKIPDGLSVVFIDGCHEYSFVLNEVELLFPKMVSGGMMCIHDIFWKTGQMSGEEKGSVEQIKYQFYGNKFVDTRRVTSMLIGRKR